MGVHFRVVIASADPTTARREARAALDEIAVIEALISDWRPDSAVSGLSRESEVRAREIPDPLRELVVRSQDLSRETGGAFDFTLGRATQAWRRAAREGRLPSPERRAAILARCGASLVSLDAAGRLSFARPGVLLDFGGIAKGWCAQRVSDRLRAAGFPAHLVDAGGDLVLGAPPPGRAGWRIRIGEDGPEHELRDVAVAGSGDAFRHLILEGRRYSHIVDPATGLGLVDAPPVTVVAADGARADAMASAISVLRARGISREECAHRFPDLEIH
ncbi:MAG: FAD:protein FMN transferase [Planctomycetota bacterium]